LQNPHSLVYPFDGLVQLRIRAPHMAADPARCAGHSPSTEKAHRTMRVFLDFEASSLGPHGYPIEVGWVFEDGQSESHLIRPAPGWDDWDAGAEAIHHIERETLMRTGEPHAAVAQRMIEALSGHELYASAPSWDGKWLSALLRAAGLPRHALGLQDTEDARAEAVAAILRGTVPEAQLADAVETVLVLAEMREGSALPRHRALADAEQERARWLMVRAIARERAAQGDCEDQSAAGGASS